MQRTEQLNLIQYSRRFLEQHLHMGAIFSHNVRIVAPGIVQPVALKVYLIGKELAVKRAKGSKGICGEQRTVREVQRHHGLRPVDHGRLNQQHLVAAKFAMIPLLHLL